MVSDKIIKMSTKVKLANNLACKMFFPTSKIHVLLFICYLKDYLIDNIQSKRGLLIQSVC